MKIILIQSPSWLTKTPPYNLALLSAVLKRDKFEPICFDFNIDFYNHCKENGEVDTWQGNDEGSSWYDERYVYRLVKEYESYLNKFICKVLETDSTVIGFTLYSSSRIFSDYLAKKIKENDPSRIIIFGGPECFRNCGGTYILEKKPWVDAICLGEAEESLSNLLRTIQDKGKIGHSEGFAYRDSEGNIIDCGDYPLIDNLDSLPYADFSQFDLTKYTECSLPIGTSRGCVRRCSFCNESVHWRKYRNRSAKNVYEEILHQLNSYPMVNKFFFNDSLVNGDIRNLDELCDLIIKNNVRISWGGQAIIRKEMTRDFLNKLKQANCCGLGYGLESGSDRILNLMRKGYDSRLAEQVIRDTHDSGIGFTFNVIVGFPGETEVEFQETLSFLKRNIGYTPCIPLNPLYILKDSQLYKEKEKLGIRLRPGSDEGTFWYTDDNTNNYEERLRRLNICKNLIGDKIRTDINKFYVNKKSFVWHLHYGCNYRCPYCRLQDRWRNPGKLNQYIEPQEWLAYWQRVYNKYGTIRIRITGGEPFMYPGFIKLIKLLSSIHSLEVTTNLSGDIKTFFGEVSPERVDLVLNFHPLFADIETFIKKTLLLKEAGFRTEVFYLAYPPQIELTRYYKEKFERHGISLAVINFWGQHNGISYPQGYTQQEKELIGPYIVGNQPQDSGNSEYMLKCDNSDSQPITDLSREDIKLSDGPSSSGEILLSKEEIKGDKTQEYIFPREKIPPHRAFFTWDIHYNCNFRCPYCYYVKFHDQVSVENRYPGIEKLIKAWRGVFKRYGDCHLHITGGEPTIYPDFFELVKALSENNTVEIDTNMSFDASAAVNKLNPQKVTIAATYHPLSADFKTFMDTASRLNDNGFRICIELVAYPPQFEKIKECKAVLSKVNIPFKIGPFRGEFNGKAYPESYTLDEKALIGNYTDKVSTVMQLKWFGEEQKKGERKGKACRMGQMYAKIRADGKAYRCCSKKEEAKLGNLFEGSFALLDEPRLCTEETCVCYRAMVIGEEDDWKGQWKGR